MNMKDHLLCALREQIASWESLLSGMSEAQLATPLETSPWTAKDLLAHVYAWQQRTIARFQAALADRPPVYPQWLPGVVPDTEDVNDRVNAWLYDTYHDFPWTELHALWLDSYHQLISLAESIPQPELLDSDRYPWMSGYALAHSLLATYDHHQEHYDMLAGWLETWPHPPH